MFSVQAPAPAHALATSSTSSTSVRVSSSAALLALTCPGPHRRLRELSHRLVLSALWQRLSRGLPLPRLCRQRQRPPLHFAQRHLHRRARFRCRRSGRLQRNSFTDQHMQHIGRRTCTGSGFVPSPPVLPTRPCACMRRVGIDQETRRPANQLAIFMTIDWSNVYNDKPSYVALMVFICFPLVRQVAEGTS